MGPAKSPRPPPREGIPPRLSATGRSPALSRASPSLALLREMERDLCDTIPPEGGADSRRLFGEMTSRALALLSDSPQDSWAGARLLDLAAGMGQDSRALARGRRGLTVGTEPSHRMIRFGQEAARAEDGQAPLWVRGFAEGLPFAAGSFDAVLCKGAMDHFASPETTMAEIARVLRPGGRAVLAVANYDSLSCRLGRRRDERRARRDAGFTRDGRPYYEPPPDHLTRFGYREILALVRPPLRIERVVGLSLLWGFPPWGAWLARLPGPAPRWALGAAFGVARLLPAQADVILIRAVKAGAA